MTAKLPHICKFKRLRYKSGSEIYFCTLPDCNKKFNTSLTLGKRSLCWRCGEPFIMNEYSIRLAKPHCEGCHQPKIVNNSVDSITGDSYNGEQPLTLLERLQQTTQFNPNQSEGEDEI